MTNYQRIIDSVIELAGDKMNDWETGFIDDISTKYFNRMDKLSDKQKDMVVKIRDKYLKHN